MFLGTSSTENKHINDNKIFKGWNKWREKTETHVIQELHKDIYTHAFFLPNTCLLAGGSAYDISMSTEKKMTSCGRLPGTCHALKCLELTSENIFSFMPQGEHTVIIGQKRIGMLWWQILLY